MARYSKIVSITFLIAVCVAALFYLSRNRTANPPNPSGPNQEQMSFDIGAGAGAPATSTVPVFNTPITDWQSRVTKKPFGIYITLQNSPVQPERFNGYHTGVDFETFPDEQNTDVLIYAICDGPLKVKEATSGYGGVAVQACPRTKFGVGAGKLDGEDITVIYGHLRLSSISANVGQELKAGEKLAVLGTGFSQETDGERKHLHLGIHKGMAISILGYVQSASQLDNWIDVTKYLK
ncbi:MAG: M23 family metallopeptidase [bacterium]